MPKTPGIRIEAVCHTGSFCESCGGEDFNNIYTLWVGDRKPTSFTLCRPCGKAFKRGVSRVTEEATNA